MAGSGFESDPMKGLMDLYNIGLRGEWPNGSI